MNAQSLKMRRMAWELLVRIHAMTLQAGLEAENTGNGREIRQSVILIIRNLVMGCRPRCPQEDQYRFLEQAKHHTDETADHLDEYVRTVYTDDEKTYLEIREDLDSLRTSLYLFMSDAYRMTYQQPYLIG